jgi:hypothetical protein
MEINFLGTAKNGLKKKQKQRHTDVRVFRPWNLPLCVGRVYDQRSSKISSRKAHPHSIANGP